jgi:hypothetical protein
MMPAMEWLALEDLREPGATLGAGVSAGFLAGVLIGGVGGRLAMLALRLTSDPSLHGVSTDDGFTIGRVSLQTLFLLGVTAGLGMAGGLFYLVVRRWIPSRWRIPLMTLFFALVGAPGSSVRARSTSRCSRRSRSRWPSSWRSPRPTARRSTPELVDAWRSTVVTWLGRVALVIIAFASGAGLVRDGIDILG